MDSKADQRRLTVKALGSRGLPTLKLPNQRCQAQRFEIADFLFGRALSIRNLSYASKFDRSPAFLDRLFDLGRERAPRLYEDTSLRDQFTRRLASSGRPLR